MLVAVFCTSAAAQGSGTTPRDTTPPLLRGLSVTNARFRVGTKSTAQFAANRGTPVGTTFKMNVSEPGTVVIAIAGKLAGREAGSRCVVGGTRGRRCALIVEPGAIVRFHRGPGNVSIPFSGTLDSTRLKPGSYVAVAAALDEAENESNIEFVRFTVVP